MKPSKKAVAAVKEEIRLTDRQNEVLAFVSAFIEENEYPPTRGEICLHFGFKSPTAAYDHLKALEKKGLVKVFKGCSRGVKVLQFGKDLLQVA